MKRMYTLLLPVLAMSILLSGCNNATTEKAKDTVDSVKNMVQEAVPGSVKSSHLSFEISHQSAYDMQQAFLSLEDESIKIPQGFQLTSEDVTGMLGAPDNHDNVDIYMMYGYKADANDGNGAFEMIFCVNDGSSGWKYYDFTKSCPNYCPTTPNGGDPDLPERGTLGDLRKLQNGLDIKGYWLTPALAKDIFESDKRNYLMYAEGGGKYTYKEIYLVKCDDTCSENIPEGFPNPDHTNLSRCQGSGNNECHIISNPGA